MSDKPEKEKKADAPESAGVKKKAGIAALLTKLPVMLGGVMAVEAVVLLLGVKMLSGGPTAAAGAEIELHGDADAPADAAHADDHGAKAADAHAGGKDAHGDKTDAKPARTVDPKKSFEMSVVEFRAPNKQGGRTFLYDVSIWAVVRGTNKSKVESAIKDREALIKDRVRTIIAQSEPDKLVGASEPGLETLRRQVKYQLDEIIGEGLIDEVLVPKCIPFRTDF
ncbi:MAG TPA: hypothetical protein VF624_06175 [Tepidisphaeraceae bacterium]|jgi:flagellar basal body-associated protein FliL